MISRTFTKEKETKGTVMYREDTENDERGWIGTIYILKDKLPKSNCSHKILKSTELCMRYAALEIDINSNIEKCPVETSIDVLAGKWKILILWYLRSETKRYSEFSL